MALYITLCVALGIPVCGHKVEKSKVLYFAGEIYVDIEFRWIKLCEENGVEPKDVDVVFMPSLEKLSTESSCAVSLPR